MRPKSLPEYDDPRIVERVNEMGLRWAAVTFNASKSTLTRWLKDQGYEIKRVYVKRGEQPLEQEKAS